MTSPCETATHTASAPCAFSTSASRLRIASSARACICAIDSPGYSSPSGNRTADGWSWTVRQSSSLASSPSLRPVHAP